jgi:hypothetical protein
MSRIILNGVADMLCLKVSKKSSILFRRQKTSMSNQDNLKERAAG